MDQKQWKKLLRKNTLNEENRKMFPVDVIKKIAKMTDQNDHTQARIEIAKVLKDKKAVSDLEKVDAEHKRIGHIPYNLIRDRDAVEKKLLKQVKASYVNSNDVHKSL